MRTLVTGRSSRSCVYSRGMPKGSVRFAGNVGRSAVPEAMTLLPKTAARDNYSVIMNHPAIVNSSRRTIRSASVGEQLGQAAADLALDPAPQRCQREREVDVRMDPGRLDLQLPAGAGAADLRLRGRGPRRYQPEALLELGLEALEPPPGLRGRDVDALRDVDAGHAFLRGRDRFPGGKARTDGRASPGRRERTGVNDRRSESVSMITSTQVSERRGVLL